MEAENTMSPKACRSCGASDRNASGNCRPCGSLASKKWVELNSVKAAALQKKSKLKNPLRVKLYDAKWYLDNLAKAKANNKAWTQANPQARKDTKKKRAESITLAGGTLSKGIREKLYTLQQGLCPCCRVPLGDDYHLDHILPIALSGTNTDDNVQLLRKVCNAQKWAHDPLYFMQKRGFLL